MFTYLSPLSTSRVALVAVLDCEFEELSLHTQNLSMDVSVRFQLPRGKGTNGESNGIGEVPAK